MPCLIIQVCTTKPWFLPIALNASSGHCAPGVGLSLQLARPFVLTLGPATRHLLLINTHEDGWPVDCHLPLWFSGSHIGPS